MQGVVQSFHFEGIVIKRDCLWGYAMSQGAHEPAVIFREGRRTA